MNIPTKKPGQKFIYYKKEAEEWGEYPLLSAHPVNFENNNNVFAYACNLTVFRNIANGHARILNYDFSAKSLFSLKCHFHSNNKTFTYRSDRYKGDFYFEFERMLLLAKQNLTLTYSMQLYDNRRAAPDDLILSWKNGEITYQDINLPAKPTKYSEKDIDRTNLLAKFYFPYSENIHTRK